MASALICCMHGAKKMSSRSPRHEMAAHRLWVLNGAVTNARKRLPETDGVIIAGRGEYDRVRLRSGRPRRPHACACDVRSLAHPTSAQHVKSFLKLDRTAVFRVVFSTNRLSILLVAVSSQSGAVDVPLITTTASRPPRQAWRRIRGASAYVCTSAPHPCTPAAHCVSAFCE